MTARTEKKIRNNQPVEVGDLVKCLFFGSDDFDKTGLVLERIHYVPIMHSNDHPDEYNCKVLFDTGKKMIRGKWLKVLSKNIEKEEVYNNIST
jgi:hypothetical protein